MSDQSDSTPVNLLINGAPRNVRRDCTVESLIVELGFERRRVAIAVNRDVVPRSAFATHRLGPGDRGEILEAAGGG